MEIKKLHNMNPMTPNDNNTLNGKRLCLFASEDCNSKLVVSNNL